MKRFTLIELLVVVAIIGILASLLLPSLGKARKTSQSAVCKNNLKNMGLGLKMMVEDGVDANSDGNYSGWSETPPDRYPEEYRWFAMIENYMGGTTPSDSEVSSGGIWDCPSAETRLDTYTRHNIHYGYNLWLHGWADSLK